MNGVGRELNLQHILKNKHKQEIKLEHCQIRKFNASITESITDHKIEKH